MKLYLNLNDSHFISSFEDSLNLQRLIDNAVPLSDKQKNINNGKFQKECCLDFCGISASLLQDQGKSCFEKILENKSLFNDLKIRLHFRFLLVYPYSAHALARIQAETSQNRATIKEPAIYYPEKVESVNMHTFETSNFVNTQRLFLRYIGIIMSRHQMSENSENRLTLRFTPTAVNVCMYRVNNVIYITPYLLAKDCSEDNKCVTRSPVIEINRSNDRETFEAYIDHFRYLWGLSQAIYFQDATQYTKLFPEGITQIKKPTEVDFSVKAKTIKDRGVHGDASSWRRQVKDLLFRLCPVIPEKVQTKESIFIACSWREKDKYSGIRPNQLAIKLKTWIKNDLGNSVDVQIVEAKPGEELFKNIYNNLNSSTVGIILLTGDIKGTDGKYYAKPNIYHELGYLMAKYSAQGYDTKVIPIIQHVDGNCIVVPSNIFKTTAINLQDNRIEAIYDTIIVTVKELLYLDNKIVCMALNSHLQRIEELVLSNIISEENGFSWKETVSDRIKTICTGDCNELNCSMKL